MKINRSKLIISIAAFAVILASVSTAVTFAWLYAPKWTDISLNTGDKKIKTHIINRNFLKEYTADGVYKETQINSNVTLTSPDEEPKLGDGVAYATDLNVDLLLDNFLLDADQGYVQNYENYWVAFSEYNVKQDLKDVYIRGNYKAQLSIKDNDNPPATINNADYENLFKINCIIDTNNYTENNATPRGTAHNVLGVKANMDSLIQYKDNLTSIPLDTELTTSFFNGTPEDPGANFSQVHVNTNVSTNVEQSISNIYYKKSYALGFGIGIHVDPMEFFRLIKTKKLGKNISATVKLFVTFNVSNKPFTDTEIVDPV